MAGVATDPGMYLAVGSLLTILGMVGFAASPRRTKPVTQCLLHPIKNRIAARQTADHYVSSLELSAHYFYSAGLLALLAWLLLLLFGF